MITITQGDEHTITLTCPSHDLTGATLTTKFKTEAEDLEIPNSQHTINPDQTTYTGKFTIALTEADTLQMVEGTGLDIIVKVEQSGDIIHFHGKKILTVKRNTVRPVE